MGKALKKFAFDKKEYKEQMLSEITPWGVAEKASKDGHPIVGSFLGSPGSAGAKAKNTGKSKLKEVAAAGGTIGGVGGALGGALIGSRIKGIPPSKRAAFIATIAAGGAATGAAGGAAARAAGYGLGHVFGENKNKKK